MTPKDRDADLASQALDFHHARRYENRARRPRLSKSPAAVYQRSHYDRRIAHDPGRLARRAEYMRAWRADRRAHRAAARLAAVVAELCYGPGGPRPL